jgi:hypothetical protein
MDLRLLSTIHKFTACLCVFISFGWLTSTYGQSRQPQARKFDEFTTGIGGPEYRWLRNYEEQDKELKLRFARYTRQLRKEGARPYAITYSPRVVEWEVYNRSIAGMRAGALWQYQTASGFDWRHINWVNGGFREVAATELWIVPPGAQPPCPTPDVSPEDVVYCPSVWLTASPYVPGTNPRLRFKAVVYSNDKKIQPKYRWEVSRGSIIEGSETDTITVELPPSTSGQVVAKVEVIGYSLECPVGSTAGVGVTTVGVSHFKFDEFGNIASGDTKARLDNLAVTLQEDPTLQVHIVVYGGRTGPRAQAQRRATWLRDYLVNTRGVAPERIITLVGGHRNELSGELWLSQRGAGAPVVRPTVDESYVVPEVKR